MSDEQKFVAIVDALNAVVLSPLSWRLKAQIVYDCAVEMERNYVISGIDYDDAGYAMAVMESLNKEANRYRTVKFNLTK